MLTILYISLLSTSIIHTTNLLINYIDYQAKWFQLHTITNLFVTAFSLNDTIDCLLDPQKAVLPASNSFALMLVIILHLYHILGFKLRLEDWYHHVSGFIVTPVMLLNNTKAVSTACFFMSGFPGGIDYGMLVLVKNNVVSKKRQKQICSYLNAYIRQPGGVISSYLLFHSAIKRDVYVSYYLFFAFTVFLNATFYSKQAIENYSNHKNIIHTI